METGKPYVKGITENYRAQPWTQKDGGEALSRRKQGFESPRRAAKIIRDALGSGARGTSANG